MSQPVIEVSHLTKCFRPAVSFREMLRGRMVGRPLWALREVSFHCNAGEILGIIGPNGAGKTTLLRLVAGLLIPTSGRVDVLGIDAAHAPSSFRERVTYMVADERAFSLWLTGRQNLHFFATLHGWSGKQRRDHVQEKLETVGLAAHADRPVATYSTGMRARLALARSLLGCAEVLLLDEPTRGIDPWAAVGFRRLLKQLATEGRTLLVSSHNLDEVRELCQRAAVLQEGQLLGCVPVGEAPSLVHA